MKRKITGLLLCAALLGGIAAPTSVDGTQPVPPPNVPPQAAAVRMADGTQPVPPPNVPPYALLALLDDGTQPVPPPHVPPAIV
jgi:hypothetical protein